MIRRTFTLFAAAALVAGVQPTTAAAQESRPSSSYPDDLERYSDEQLDNLVGPIALYPDALLAQVLVAATFPDQIDEAARFVRANGTSDIDDQSWDVSVKSVAHYPSALNMMADKSDWTTTLGRAYASQSSDVMAAVQRMRAMADAQGNLQSTPQQNIVRDDDDYVIAPMNPRVIYVPVYDPYVVYTRPIYSFGYQSSFWSFGVGFPIGGWLSYDCNWRSRSVYYNGWNRSYYGYAGGWRGRSAPYIHISNVYVNSRYRNVYINRDVIRRRVDYRNVDRYQGVHRDTRFGGRDVDYRDGRDRARNSPDRSRTVDRARAGSGTYGTYGRTNERGTWNSSDARGGNRGDNRSDGRGDNRDNRTNSGGMPGTYDGGTRNRDNGRPSQNGGRTIGDARGGSVGGYSSDNGGRTIGDGRGGSVGGPDNNRGRTIGDGRGGSIGGNSDNGRGDWGRDRQRNDGGNRDRGAASGAMRGPSPRNEQPMVNPRRGEGQQGPSGNGGQRGGDRGGSRGGDRGGRERPKF
ncbi:MAG: DUF3300 domain-containing protein [Gemmatimonadaceae bacterium]|nr:DUF3300 domain-containing protein [Gemmatimonadaceae bacterium]